MTKELIIIALVIALIYLYYSKRKKTLFYNTSDSNQAQEISENISNLKSELEDLVSEKDSATRKKIETEQELIAVSNKLKNKQQEISRKDTEITRLKKEKSKVEIALNAKLKEWKEKYSKQGQLLDTEQTENNKITNQISQLETKITELETERKNLLDQANKHSDLDEFQNWLNEKEENKANLPDWDKILTEIKDKIRDYHLQENNWASGLLKRNSKYYQVFKNWLEYD